MIVVVAGGAGTGKSTLADRLARELDAPHCDFDVIGAAMVEQARAEDPDRSDASLVADLRDARYRALADAVSAAATTSPVVFVSAPFSRHLADPARWQDWLATAERNLPVGARHPAVLLWLDLDPQERWQRMARRAEPRDAQAIAAGPDPHRAPAPAIACIRLDASEDPASLVAAALAAIESRAPGSRSSGR